MKDVVGTNAVTGLNVKEAAHLIQPHQLQESKNGWTEEDGAWSVARRPESIYTSSGILAYEAGRMNGADHHVWISGTTLYDNGVSKGTITGADSSTDIVAVDDAFVIVAAGKNYIYDGDHVREMGAPQPDYIYAINESSTGGTWSTITGITAANPAVITLNTNLYNVGDRIYIAGITTGPTALNTRYFTVTASSGSTITINYDTSSLTAWSAGGTVVPGADLAGDYRFYVVPTVRLSDGSVLKGQPRGLKIETDTTLSASEYDLGPTDTYEPSVLSLSAGDYVQLGQGHSSPLEYFRLYFTKSGTQLFEISGTAGTDYFRGLQIYRTKANGYDAYLEREYFEDDDECSAFTDGTDAGIDVLTMYVGVPDADLGAVLDYDFIEHTNMPQSEFVAFAGQRAWVASGNTLYWSTLDGIEYGSEANNTLMFDSITALGSWRDYCIVFSADRMWAVRIAAGFPEVENIPTPAGTIWPKALRETNLGLLYARTDGVYVYNGGQPQKMSRWAFKDLVAPSSVVQAGDIIYVCGSEAAYIAQDRGDGWTWHESDHDVTMASQTSGALYGADGVRVYSLFTGARVAGSLKTKKFGGFDSSCTYKMEIDYAGDSIPTVIVNGNVMSDVKEHEATIPYSYPDRRVLWVYLPRLTNNYVEAEIGMVGNAEVFGFRFFKEM